jgi:hypothetical protein
MKKGGPGVSIGNPLISLVGRVGIELTTIWSLFFRLSSVQYPDPIFCPCRPLFHPVGLLNPLAGLYHHASAYNHPLSLPNDFNAEFTALIRNELLH